MLHNDSCCNSDVSYVLARDAALRVLMDSRVKDIVFSRRRARAMDGFGA